MAFDAGFLRTICEEINGELSDSRLERVFQCTRDTFVLEFRAAKKPRALFLSAGPSGGFCYLTERKISHPDVPPMFCMLLRKHLTGGRFLRAEQIGFERVLRLDIEFFDAFGSPLLRSVYLEAMGKNSNLILCDEKGVILGALRTLDLAQCPERPLITGMNYAPPPRRASALSLLDDGIGFHLKKALKEAGEDQRACDVLLASVMGIGPAVAREMVYRSCGDASARVSEVREERLLSEIERLRSLFEQKTFTYSAVYAQTATGRRAVEYSYLDLSQYQGLEFQTYCAPSLLMDCVAGEKEERERLRGRTERASAVLKAAMKRLKKKHEALLGDLAEAQTCEKSRIAGDLIMQEIWRLKRGDTKLEAVDYETGETVVIELDARLTPAQNAQRCYKHYQKQKRALVCLEEQLSETLEQLRYAESISESLLGIESVRDAEEICKEVSQWEYGRRFAKNVPQNRGKPKKALPYEVESFISPGGFTVLRGKNNLQNEELTFRIASKNDVWFHAKGRPGPHVVLHLEGTQEVSEADFEFAARLAIPRDLYEVGCEVDYTKVKFVKHHPSRLPGRVIYTGEKAVFVRKEG